MIENGPNITRGIAMDTYDPRFIRQVPGWENAPVPVCFGGDPRGLTFCCDPHYPLAFADKCRRHAVLEMIGLSEEALLTIKKAFSQEHGLDHEGVCFNSLAFCCLRRRGCMYRDRAIIELLDGDLERYFKLKRLLAKQILEAAENQEYVKAYLEE